MLAQWTTPFVSESTPDELQRAERATVDYLTRLIAAKRAEPGEFCGPTCQGAGASWWYGQGIYSLSVG